MKNIIFIAAPAAGKGTQCELLVEKYGYTHISTGDLLREEISNGNKELEEILKAGKLVDDETVFNILENKLKTINGPIVLDGFPRTLRQCEMYHELCEKLDIDEGITIYLEVDKATAMHRVLGRITCSKCNKIYNKYTENMKPKTENICDICNIPLTSRSDDNEETFTNRFNTYLENVKPILDYYRNKEMLTTVATHENKFDTFKDIENLLKENND